MNDLMKRIKFALTPKGKRRWVVRQRGPYGRVTPVRHCEQVKSFSFLPWSIQHNGHLCNQSMAEHVAFCRNMKANHPGVQCFTERVI